MELHAMTVHNLAESVWQWYCSSVLNKKETIILKPNLTHVVTFVASVLLRLADAAWGVAASGGTNSCSPKHRE
eukprot:2777887-Amphidinium_carterae.1